MSARLDLLHSLSVREERVGFVKQILIRCGNLLLRVTPLVLLLSFQGEHSGQPQSLSVSKASAQSLPAEGSLRERPFFDSRGHPAIGYSARQAADAVAELARAVSAGEIRLRFDPNTGYLPSLLESLKVPIASQSMVFSKTSQQASWIKPTTPRAIFYTDDVAVAYIQNSPLLELSALDPVQGVVFYSLKQEEAARPQITRDDSCLACHESRNTLDVPGMLALSVGARAGGETVLEFANFAADHRTPFEDRWGGWFVTGRTGSANHLGNFFLVTEGAGRPSGPGNPWLTLSGRFSARGYLSSYSDVAALMVLEHQVGMTNLLTRAGYEARVALSRMAENPGERVAAERLIESNAREVADYMLFVDEAVLPGPFQSTSGFQEKFAESGPRDRQGRSLRQLDLEKRLMRYPCSYMIYSRVFDGLPGPAKTAVYAQLWNILSGKDRGAKYSRISDSDRAAIVEILLETKKDLPSYFTSL